MTTAEGLASVASKKEKGSLKILSDFLETQSDPDLKALSDLIEVKDGSIYIKDHDKRTELQVSTANEYMRACLRHLTANLDAMINADDACDDIHEQTFKLVFWHLSRTRDVWYGLNSLNITDERVRIYVLIRSCSYISMDDWGDEIGQHIVSYMNTHMRIMLSFPILAMLLKDNDAACKALIKYMIDLHGKEEMSLNDMRKELTDLMRKNISKVRPEDQYKLMHELALPCTPGHGDFTHGCVDLLDTQLLMSQCRLRPEKACSEYTGDEERPLIVHALASIMLELEKGEEYVRVTKIASVYLGECKNVTLQGAFTSRQNDQLLYKMIMFVFVHQDRKRRLPQMIPERNNGWPRMHDDAVSRYLFKRGEAVSFQTLASQVAKKTRPQDDNEKARLSRIQHLIEEKASCFTYLPLALRTLLAAGDLIPIIPEDTMEFLPFMERASTRALWALCRSSRVAGARSYIQHISAECNWAGGQDIQEAKRWVTYISTVISIQLSIAADFFECQRFDSSSCTGEKATGEKASQGRRFLQSVVLGHRKNSTVLTNYQKNLSSLAQCFIVPILGQNFGAGDWTFLRASTVIQLWNDEYNAAACVPGSIMGQPMQHPLVAHLIAFLEATEVPGSVLHSSLHTNGLYTLLLELVKHKSVTQALAWVREQEHRPLTQCQVDVQRVSEMMPYMPRTFIENVMTNVRCHAKQDCMAALVHQLELWAEQIDATVSPLSDALRKAYATREPCICLPTDGLMGLVGNDRHHAILLHDGHGEHGILRALDTIQEIQVHFLNGQITVPFPRCLKTYTEVSIFDFHVNYKVILPTLLSSKGAKFDMELLRLQHTCKFFFSELKYEQHIHSCLDKLLLEIRPAYGNNVEVASQDLHEKNQFLLAFMCMFVGTFDEHGQNNDVSEAVENYMHSRYGFLVTYADLAAIGAKCKNQWDNKAFHALHAMVLRNYELKGIFDGQVVGWELPEGLLRLTAALVLMSCNKLITQEQAMLERNLNDLKKRLDKEKATLFLNALLLVHMKRHLSERELDVPEWLLDYARCCTDSFPTEKTIESLIETVQCVPEVEMALIQSGTFIDKMNIKTMWSTSQLIRQAQESAHVMWANWNDDSRMITMWKLHLDSSRYKELYNEYLPPWPLPPFLLKVIAPQDFVHAYNEIRENLLKEKLAPVVQDKPLQDRVLSAIKRYLWSQEAGHHDDLYRLYMRQVKILVMVDLIREPVTFEKIKAKDDFDAGEHALFTKASQALFIHKLRHKEEDADALRVKVLVLQKGAISDECVYDNEGVLNHPIAVFMSEYVGDNTILHAKPQDIMANVHHVLNETFSKDHRKRLFIGMVTRAKTQREEAERAEREAQEKAQQEHRPLQEVFKSYDQETAGASSSNANKPAAAARPRPARPARPENTQPRQDQGQSNKLAVLARWLETEEEGEKLTRDILNDTHFAVVENKAVLRHGDSDLPVNQGMNYDKLKVLLKDETQHCEFALWAAQEEEWQKKLGSDEFFNWSTLWRKVDMMQVAQLHSVFPDKVPIVQLAMQATEASPEACSMIADMADTPEMNANMITLAERMLQGTSDKKHSHSDKLRCVCVRLKLGTVFGGRALPDDLQDLRDIMASEDHLDTFKEKLKENKEEDIQEQLKKILQTKEALYMVPQCALDHFSKLHERTRSFRPHLIRSLQCSRILRNDSMDLKLFNTLDAMDDNAHIKARANDILLVLPQNPVFVAERWLSAADGLPGEDAQLTAAMLRIWKALMHLGVGFVVDRRDNKATTLQRTGHRVIWQLILRGKINSSAQWSEDMCMEADGDGWLPFLVTALETELIVGRSGTVPRTCTEKGVPAIVAIINAQMAAAADAVPVIWYELMQLDSNVCREAVRVNGKLLATMAWLHWQLFKTKYADELESDTVFDQFDAALKPKFRLGLGGHISKPGKIRLAMLPAAIRERARSAEESVGDMESEESIGDEESISDSKWAGRHRQMLGASKEKQEEKQAQPSPPSAPPPRPQVQWMQKFEWGQPQRYVDTISEIAKSLKQPRTVVVDGSNIFYAGKKGNQYFRDVDDRLTWELSSKLSRPGSDTIYTILKTKSIHPIEEATEEGAIHTDYKDVIAHALRRFLRTKHLVIITVSTSCSDVVQPPCIIYGAQRNQQGQSQCQIKKSQENPVGPYEHQFCEYDDAFCYLVAGDTDHVVTTEDMQSWERLSLLHSDVNAQVCVWRVEAR